MFSPAERSREERCFSLDAVPEFCCDSRCAVGILALGWLEERLLDCLLLLLVDCDWLELCALLLDEALL
ncbi:hypothetical protein GCM10027180_08380 [Microbulbifer echini]